jgi:hypothetical protein
MDKEVDRFITKDNKVGIFEDNEGGNIFLFSPNDYNWEIDAVSDDLRIFTYEHKDDGGNTSNSFQDFWFGRDGIIRAVDYHLYSGGGLKDLHEKLYGNSAIPATINFGNKLWIFGNNEGGNIRLNSADGQHHWEMDGCTNNSLRFYHGREASHPNGASEIDSSFLFDSNTGLIHSTGPNGTRTFVDENKLTEYLHIGDNFILERIALRPGGNDYAYKGIKPGYILISVTVLNFNNKGIYVTGIAYDQPDIDTQSSWIVFLNKATTDEFIAYCIWVKK